MAGTEEKAARILMATGMLSEAARVLHSSRSSKILKIGPWRFLERLMARWSRLPRIREAALFFGGRMTVVLPEVISEQISTYGFFDEAVTRLALEAIRDGDVVFDVGAHFGYFSLLFSHLVGDGGKVISLEPTPSTFSILASNARRANNIKALNAAAGRDPGQLHITDYGLRYSAWNTLMERARLDNDPADSSRIDVEVIRLDDLVDEEGLPPDVVKIDAENYEAEVIQGLMQTLTNHPPRSIIMETGSAPALEAGKKLVMHGYRVYVWDAPGILRMWSRPLEEANRRFKDILFSRESLSSGA